MTGAIQSKCDCPAQVFSVFIGMAAISQSIGGYVGARIPRSAAIAIFGFIQASGFLTAALVHSFPMALLFAAIFGAGFGGRNPPTTAIRGDYFGKKAFATIGGISSAPMYAFMLAAASCSTRPGATRLLSWLRRFGHDERCVVLASQGTDDHPLGEEDFHHPQAK